MLAYHRQRSYSLLERRICQKTYRWHSIYYPARRVETYKGWISLHKNIRSTYKDQFPANRIRLYKNAQNEYKWLAGIQMGIKEKRCIPYSTLRKKIKNAFGEIHGKYNCNLSDKLAKRLLMGISFAHNKNLSGHYLYGGSHPEYPIVTELEQGDFDYLLPTSMLPRECNLFSTH